MKLLDHDGIDEWRRMERRKKRERTYTRPEDQLVKRRAAGAVHQVNHAPVRRAKHAKDARKVLWAAAIARSRKSGVPIDDMTWDCLPPISSCGACGIALRSGCETHNPNSPSLDRVVPKLGYTWGNLAWLCYRCNRIKNDASYDDLIKIAEYVKRMTS